MMMRAGEGTSRICAGCQLRHQCVAGHWLTVPSCSVQFSGMDGGAVGGTGGPHGVCHPTAQAFLSKTTSKSFKSLRSAWLCAASKGLSSTRSGESQRGSGLPVRTGRRSGTRGCCCPRPSGYHPVRNDQDEMSDDECSHHCDAARTSNDLQAAAAAAAGGCECDQE